MRSTHAGSVPGPSQNSPGTRPSIASRGKPHIATQASFTQVIRAAASSSSTPCGVRRSASASTAASGGAPSAAAGGAGEERVILGRL